MRNGSANANTINLFIIIFIWIPIQTLYYRTINTTQHTHDTHEGHKYPAATIPCCPGTGDDALEWLATHQPKYELVAVGLIGNLSTPSPGMSFRKLAMAFIALSPLLLLRPILCPFITHRDHHDD